MARRDDKPHGPFGRHTANRLRAVFSRRDAPAVADAPAAAFESGADVLSAADLAAAVPDPVIIFDADGVILLANEAARAAFGADAGMSIYMRFRAPEMHQMVRGVIAEPDAPHAMDYVERVPMERVFRVTARPIGRDGSLRVLVFEDQSEARRIDRMRADFIANASHELRTPLASISGFIETLRGSARDDARARDRFLQIMQAQTERMARLIDDLLSLSRLEIKPYLRPATMVDMVPLLETVIDSMTHMASEAGVTIERDIADGPLHVAGHHDELVQVFENLLENACKYGASGGRIVISAARENDGVAVTVRDFGPGIAEEHIPRITERFYRVDVETSRARKGTGLGLSIVKHILSRHDARLTVASKIGEGAAFTVHFPPA